MQSREPYYVFVDESGDSGWGPTASPVFLLTAVIVKASELSVLRRARDEMAWSIRGQTNVVLHWRKNTREHDERKHAMRIISKLPITLTSVVLDKRAPGMRAALGGQREYDYLVGQLLAQVSHCVDEMGGQASVRLAHVKQVKYSELENYLDALRRDPLCPVRWEALAGRYPQVEHPDTVRELQIADAFAGAMLAVFRPDRFDDVEPMYLQLAASRLWAGRRGRLHEDGLWVVGSDPTLLPWWDDIVKAQIRN